MSTQNLQLLPSDELQLKLGRIHDLMHAQGIGSMLIGDNANKFYLTGRVFAGYIYIVSEPRTIVYFALRGQGLVGENVYDIHKPENIAEILESEALPQPVGLGLELNQLSWATVQRLAAALGQSHFDNADVVLMKARSVKTPGEIHLIEECGVSHARVYQRIPHLYQEGMTDIELQIEIEHVTRLEGGLGIFRCSGDDMELNQGSVLTGDNADAPSPYDFAMGGAGLSPALPVGADGSVIRPGNSVMVDCNGCFNGYMTDMTRTFSLGTLPPEALRAHQLSIDICRALEKFGRPGTPCSEMYNLAVQMSRDAGLEDHFMGHRKHAGFVGHGVGIAVNELPVLAPRFKGSLQEGNVIAIEPKFVIEHVGAVGIENTYAVTPDGLRNLTHAPEQIISLDR